ncbi:MAG: hypothetical protein JKY45_13075 [Emcibacter sp.]|nr:hypothetical protein [Emcibacter sp.]
MKHKKNISAIIEDCGGVSHVSRKLELTDSAIAKWRSNGIHDRYWSRIITLSQGSLTETDLFMANEQVRSLSAA